MELEDILTGKPVFSENIFNPYIKMNVHVDPDKGIARLYFNDGIMLDYGTSTFESFGHIEGSADSLLSFHQAFLENLRDVKEIQLETYDSMINHINNGANPETVQDMAQKEYLTLQVCMRMTQYARNQIQELSDKNLPEETRFKFQRVIQITNHIDKMFLEMAEKLGTLRELSYGNHVVSFPIAAAHGR